MRQLCSLIFLVVLGAAISSCTAPQPWRPILTADSTITPAIHGVWKAQGYGYVFAIGADSVAAYDDDRAGCIPSADFTRDDFVGWLQVYRTEGERLRLAEQTENATHFVMNPLDAVPEACASPPSPTPAETVAHAWGVMDEHYAFFDVYGVDWDARREAIAATLSDTMSDAALYDALVAMLADLDDRHLGLDAEVDGEPQRYRGSGKRVLDDALRAAFDAQDAEPSFGAFADAWYAENQRRIREVVLDSASVQRRANDAVVWGRRGRVGYLAIAGMGPGRYGPPSATMDERVATIHVLMDEALAALADTDALVLDIALNRGGMDRVSLAFASHFADDPTPALAKYAHGAEAATRQTYTIRPIQAERYTKPVVLLTSSVTLSAGETFALMLRALPHVTHAGSATNGALSDVLFKELANGWMLRLSNQVYEDTDGVVWEGDGIQPQRPLPMFADGIYGHATSLDTLLRDLAADR